MINTLLCLRNFSGIRNLQRDSIIFFSTNILIVILQSLSQSILCPLADEKLGNKTPVTNTFHLYAF